MTKVSVIKPPTIQFIQLSLTSTQATIGIKATDESGIFKITEEVFQGAAIIYTGSQQNPLRHPTSDSYTYQYTLTGTPGSSVNLRAKAQDHGGNWSGWYTTTITFPAPVNPPDISPASGTYPSPITMTMSCSTGEATIRYTLNGSEPTESSTEYTGPFDISGSPGSSKQVKGKGFRSGYTPSGTATRDYTFQQTDQVDTPDISPASGTYPSPITMTMSCSTGEATIRYTLNGSEPTESSTEYTGPFDISGSAGSSMQVRAKGFKSGYTPSGTATRDYTFQPAHGEMTVYLPGDVPLVLVRIPAGSSQMGSPETERKREGDEEPVHTVSIGYDFYMGRYELTQAQWVAVMGGWPHTSPGSGSGAGSDYPAYNVSWEDAQDFVAALNDYVPSTGQGQATFRLPSEAEWEYACRAGTQTRFFFGDSLGCGDVDEDCAAGTLPGNRSDYMWYRGNNNPSGAKPVGQKWPNQFGLHDMSGNVYEWCQDGDHSDYTGAPTDGSAWESPGSDLRILRGGSWITVAFNTRSANRDGVSSTGFDAQFGFRLAAELANPPTPDSISYPISDSDGSYTVSWAPSSGATSYQLERSSNDGSTWSQIYSGSSTSYSESVGNGGYRYRVRATNSAGSSGWRTGTRDCVVSIVTVPVPPASITYPTSDSDGSYTVSWASSSGATSYQLERWSNGGSTWSPIYSDSSTWYSESVGDGSYRYRVRATNSAGPSGWRTGTYVCVVSIWTVPVPPAWISYPRSDSSSDGRYTVSWASSSGATSYQLERSSNGGSTWSPVYSGSSTSYSESVGNGSYRYRVRATNSAGWRGWRTGSYDIVVSIPTATPTPTPTPSITPTPPEGPIRDLIRSFYDLVLGREPEAGAVDSWHHGYFDYAVDFDIDVRFIPREIARLFFLSEEYAARNRTNADFITDCYRVFLNRDPSQIELDDWTSGVWNRPQVMTVFSESEEFANRIQAMYPGFEGDPARNFVTFMYIGLLDRLVDKNGLEYAAGLFDATFASGGIEAVRAQAKQMAREVIVSQEFLGKQPTTADYVTRFYRAFLGRFPNDAEVAYWSGELDAGRRTTDGVIDLFADSAEFSERLRTYFGS